MDSSFSQRLAHQVQSKGSPLFLGLDPRPERFPRAFQTGGTVGGGLEGLLAFHERLIEICAPYVAGIKPQIAFFEQLGTEGLAAYATCCDYGRAAGLEVLGDIKRGDIGSTAEAYAKAHFRWAESLTVNPYLGEDSIEPFLGPCRDEGKGIFVLCVTSNPSWAQFQDRRDAEGRPLYVSVAEAIAGWNESCRCPGESHGPVGAVVGATHPSVLQEIREILPASWLLLPGVGAQGASISDLATAFDAEGLGALLPVSRGLASCFDPADSQWESVVEARALALRTEIRAAVPALGEGKT